MSEQKLTNTPSIPQPEFTQGDLKIISKRSMYKRFFQVTEYEISHKLYAGGWSRPIKREIFERGHAVVVLPYDIERDELVLIEQFRLAASFTSDTPWLFEFVAGMTEEGESEQEVALRELKEEAGLDADKITLACSYLSSPGGTSERISVFVAKVDATQAEGIHGLDDEGEDIRVHRVTRSQALEMLEQGKLDNAATVIGLQWLELHLPRLKQQWCDESSD